jgi:hypothetical protein
LKYLIILLLIVSFQLSACVSFQEKFDTDAFVESLKADEDPVIEAISVYVPARINEYKADYSYIYLKDGDDLILGSSTSVMRASIPKSISEKNDYKAIFLNIQEKYKNSIELEVHYVKPNEPNVFGGCSKVKRYRLSELKSL